MDFTKRYIKQCEKAKELQEYKRQKGWKTGDWCYDKHYNDLTLNAVNWLIWNGLKCSSNRPNFHHWDIPSPNAIWLPTQDQLQEMILQKYDMTNCIMLAEMFARFVNKNRIELFEMITSMEQLWLAYVMWELYGKVWDDEKEDWVKQEVQDD